MKAHTGLLWVAGLATSLLITFSPIQARSHSIVTLMDLSMVAQNSDRAMGPVAARTGEIILTSAESRSTPKAFILSLLIPGTGQFYTKAPGRGRIFLGTELAILAGFLGLHLYSDWKEEDYQLYAATHAGVDVQGKSKEYFEDVSLFTSMEEYNRQQLINFREEAQLYSGSDFWEWDSDSSQREFDSIYRASTNAEHNAIIVTGVVLLNHLVSAVDAARTARAYNKEHASRPSPVQLSLSVRPASGSSMVVVGLKRSF